MAAGLFTANRRIYLDAQGKPVEADDPNRASLFLAEGQSIPIAKARQLGLLSAEYETKLAELEALAAEPLDPDLSAVNRKSSRKAPANKRGQAPDNKGAGQEAAGGEPTTTITPVSPIDPNLKG